MHSQNINHHDYANRSTVLSFFVYCNEQYPKKVHPKSVDHNFGKFTSDIHRNNIFCFFAFIISLTSIGQVEVTDGRNEKTQGASIIPHR